MAALHSFVGLAAVLLGYSNYFKDDDPSDVNNIETYLGIFIGAITLTGSIVAWGKLSEKLDTRPLILLPGNGRHFFNLFIIIGCIIIGVFFTIDRNIFLLSAMTLLALILGWHLVAAIGGADMPVVVSMLNSYSGWATSVSGFTLSN